MRCPQCQFDSPPEMRFCGHCGCGLAASCPSCGIEAPPGFRFCGHCGTPLSVGQVAPVPSAPPAVAAQATATAPPTVAASAPPPAPKPAVHPTRATAEVETYTPAHLADEILRSAAALEGERKQVTVLFCDLANSTATAEKLGAETMHGLFKRIFEITLEEIHRLEGTVNQFLGDGFMALFGAPITHEDHARRAVMAALAIQHQLREAHAQMGGKHGVQLQFRIGINTGPVVVGGIGDNLRMDYTAVGDTTNLAARLQGLAEPDDILISQKTERLVRNLFAMEGLPPTRVKGKSKPVQAFKVTGLLRGARQASAFERETSSPFVGRRRELSILDDVRERAFEGSGQVVGITGEAGSGKTRLVKEFCSSMDPASFTHLRGTCLSYSSTTPYLPIIQLLRQAGQITAADRDEMVGRKLSANLKRLGCDPEEHLPYLLRLLGSPTEDEELANIEAVTLQNRTFATLLRIFLNACRLRPLVLEVADLQWIDRTSEQFLETLIESLAGAPILLLLSFRSGYTADWTEKSFATQIPVRPLSKSDSLELVTALLAERELPADLTEMMLAKGEGNPFFLEEIARAISEGDDDASVPDTVQGVLMARIDRLAEEHKRLLQTSSVLGREFSQNVLAEVHGDIGRLLKDLNRWEFLFPTPADNDRYQFKQGLTQEVIYDSLLTDRRRALHAQAGAALEALYADRPDEVLDLLAFHWSRSPHAERAVRYLILFARAAVAEFAHGDAVSALRRALERIAELPESSERNEQTLEVVLSIAESLLPLAQFPQTLELLQQHDQLLDEVDTPAIRGRFEFWRAHTYSYLGVQQEAREAAQRSITAAGEADDPITRGQACYVLSREGFWTGRFAEGSRYGAEALELLDAPGGRWWQGQAYWTNAFNHFAVGEFEAAFEAIAQATARGEELEDYRLDASWSTGYFHAALGDGAAGISHCEGGLERSKDPMNSAVAGGFLGYAYWVDGHRERAAEALRTSVEVLGQVGMLQLAGWFSAYLAEVEQAEGNAEEALAKAREGLEMTRKAHFRFGEGLSQRALGRIALERRDFDESSDHLAEALRVFERLGASYEAALTQLDQAIVLHHRGQHKAFRKLADQHFVVLDGLGAHTAMERSRARIEALPNPPLSAVS
ncbi:MAG: adenylate/guanylate cyclase domain-containing protein [Acidobacteriota bacterium]